MPIPLNTKPYCNCAERGQWQRQDGYTLDGSSGTWVHWRCRKPSKMNWERRQRGDQPIPQPKLIEDIYQEERDYELRKVSRVVIAEELDWSNESEDDYDYD